MAKRESESMSKSILGTVLLDAKVNTADGVFFGKRKTLLGFRKMRQKRTAHHPVGEHLHALFDGGQFTEEIALELETKDPLKFPGYKRKLEENRRTSESLQGCLAGIGTINGIPAVGAELSKHFMMGSMGSAEGEKLTLAIEEADRRKLPLIIFSASGGARMQEGMISLMQMAKTSAAVERLRKHGGLYISVLTHPTTGGVSASYASLGDIMLAEPGALIGFAGPRVIEQTIGEKLPTGFQRSEFQLEHGFLDKIVPREDEKPVITHILRLHGFEPEGQKDSSIREFNPFSSVSANANNAASSAESSIYKDASARESSEAEEKASDPVIQKDEKSGNLKAYDRVRLVRDKSRPKITDYINGVFDDFLELCGDRIGKEDPAIFGGIGLLNGKPVTVIGHRKGKNLAENMKCNFGMPEPQGYRKALRLMKQAEKFGRPVITFIDTPGAYPGKEAEENGQSVAIAENLAAMSDLKVPVICIVTGEGNSGGALAIGVGDEIWMLENAVYSVLSPEGFASILWKDAGKCKEASEVMKMTAQDLVDQGIADRLIPEPEGGAQKDLPGICRILKENLETELKRLEEEGTAALLEARYQKYRKIGCIGQNTRQNTRQENGQSYEWD
jgi:acetyl-CoA carboxylase carboxyl transferase alpha subunit/acetyl-CoA carboxylase carboxyl transferase beta subunit